LILRFKKASTEKLVEAFPFLVYSRSMRIKQTHTCAVLHVPKAFWDFVAEKMREAGYDHVFSHDGSMIDMNNIGLIADPTEEIQMFGKSREREVIERVKDVVYPYVSNGGKLETFTDLREALDLDSLDFVEITMDLEDEFGITIIDEEMENVTTLQDLVDLVNSSASS
jgi:acyl carrier protein